MSLQSATLGRFWIGPQTAKESAATTYYPFKGNLIDAAPGQMTRNLGSMVGGSLLPAGSIKTAAWSGGGMTLPPPLDDYIGWLLYAFAGTASTVDNGDSTYTHYFPSGADSESVARYLTARRTIPGSSTLYEQMEDMVPVRLLWSFTPGEFAVLRSDMIGRTPTKPTSFDTTFNAKDQSSVPIACKGHFELPDETPITTATAVTLEIANLVPDLRQVLTLGSYYPLDFPVLGRAATINFSYLWENSTLYETLYYSGTAWSPIIYNSSVEVEVQSPGFITGALPYKLSFYADSVDWQCQPIALAGGDLVQLNMTGSIADSSAAGHDWYLALTNGTASYTWPTP